MREVNQQKGHAARAAGEELERILANTHEWYEAQGVGLVAKREAEPYSRKVIGDGAVDFRGRLDGVRVAFDAKQSGRTASYRHPEKSFHQLIALRRVQARGGAGFILMYDPFVGHAFLISDLRRLLEGHSQPVRTDNDGASFRPLVPCIPLDERTGYLDYWPTVRDIILARGEP